ncbi:Alginate regulatory protein AlgP [Polaromonas sp. CG9_12]|nr:Alginate regulatory protein AlgP [Polaromonas sp. CG9_12]
MSNANTPSFPDFGKLVPGFDFLQNLAKQAAGSATHAIPQLPNLGNWIAPTLNVEELDKRVQELKAVQFWLDQNAAALKATIQALEVQKMTLATLKGMNFNMGEVANAFKLKVGDSLSGGMQRTADKPKGFAGLEIPPSAFQASKEKADTGPDAGEKSPDSGAEAGDAPAPATGLADPMQWWGALTQQFQAIAAEAMKEVAKTSAIDASKSMAAGMAKDAVRTATDMAKNMAETASKTMAGGTRAAMNTAMAGSWPKAGAAKETAVPTARKSASKTGAGKSAAAKSPAAKAAPKTATKAKTPARKTTR